MTNTEYQIYYKNIPLSYVDDLVNSHLYCNGLGYKTSNGDDDHNNKLQMT